MFRIGIAEDDPSFQKTISEYIERYKKEKNVDIQASFFQDGSELVFKYEPIYDVLLLDIEMPKMNGMDAAREIRKRDQRVLIIFITNMAQYAINGYEVGALDFVLKPIKYFSFSMKLEKALKSVKGYPYVVLRPFLMDFLHTSCSLPCLYSAVILHTKFPGKRLCIALHVPMQYSISAIVYI